MNSMNQLLALLPDGGWQRLMSDALWQSALIAAIGWLVAKFFVRQAAARAWVLLLAISACVVVPIASAASRSAGWTFLSQVATTSASASIAVEPSPLAGEGRVRRNKPLSSQPATSASPAFTAAPLESADVALDRALPLPINVPKKHFRPLEVKTQQSVANPTNLAQQSSSIDWYRIFGIAWLAASAILALRLVSSTLAVRKIIRRATTCEDPQILAAANEAFVRVGLRRAPMVLMSADIESPMVLALGKPRLLVPQTNESNAQDINWTAAFTHELAHVVRGDGWSRLWVEIITIALPLQPLLWLVRRNYYLACEEACDDWSVSAGSDPVDLAATLTAWLDRRTPSPATAIGMSSTKARVLRLLAMREKPSTKVPRVCRWLGVPSVLFVIAGLAMAQVPGEKPIANQSTASSVEESQQLPHTQHEIDPATELLTEIIVSFDPAVGTLKQRLGALDEALQWHLKAVKYPESDPAVRRLKAQIADLKKRYDERCAKLSPEAAKQAKKMLLPDHYGLRRQCELIFDAQQILDNSESSTLSDDESRVTLWKNSLARQREILRQYRDTLTMQVHQNWHAEQELRNELEPSKTLTTAELINPKENETQPTPTVSPYLNLSGNDKSPPDYRSMVNPNLKALPTYVIEPPDILSIETIQAVPKKPTRIAPLDVINLEIVGTLPNQGTSRSTITGGFVVDTAGEVVLGPAYGAVKISGLTRREAQDAVEEHLRKFLANLQVALTLDESRVTKGIAGEHLVGPDGNVTLGQFGKVSVTGLTLEQARAAIEKHLGAQFESPVIGIDISSYNSKVYYVIAESKQHGDNIQRFPITGNETVLDAISQFQGLSRFSSKNIWVARPTPNGKDQILPVNWDEITRKGNTATNYQVLPGDRVFIAGTVNYSVVIVRRVKGQERPAAKREEIQQFISTEGADVLDAIKNVGKPSDFLNAKISIARRTEENPDEIKNLAVSLKDIESGITATNYKLQPFDRVIIDGVEIQPGAPSDKLPQGSTPFEAD